MNHHEVDVLIIGAGPSGTAAAYDLAASGSKVLIVDRQSFPRHKACGGSLSKRAIDRLRYPLDGIVRSEVSRITITHKARVGTYVHTPAPVVQVTSRYDLDNLMLQQAIGVGATFIKVGKKPLGIKEDGQGVVVSWEDISVSAKWLIAADGANSQTRAMIFGKQIQQQCMAIEGDAVAPANLPEDARCDFGYAEHGYGWLVRKGREVNIGLYTTQAQRDELGHQQLRDYARNVYGIEDLQNIKAAPVGTHGYKVPLATRRVFFVGDAAGFADTLYGEGLFGTLLTGQQAAESILNHSEATPAWQSYRKKLRFWQRRLLYIRFLSFSLYLTLPLIYPVFQRHFRKQWARDENLMKRQ